jgi:hypothetical protein
VGETSAFDERAAISSIDEQASEIAAASFAAAPIAAPSQQAFPTNQNHECPPFQISNLVPRYLRIRI